MPLPPGVLPAMVTPMDESGKPDPLSAARLMAGFEAEGCVGVVVAGTNGEGPSLAAVEKRDLIRELVPAAGRLRVVLGVATPSLSEALWSAQQAAKAGAHALLVMPPGYFPEAPGVEAWLAKVVAESPLPVLLYNYPQRTGIALKPAAVGRIAAHPNCIGVKDSSGDAKNLAAYRGALGPDKLLYMGVETLLLDALDAGWSGSISGAANLVAAWLARAVKEHRAGGRPAAETAFALLLPVLQAIRSEAQPAANKAALHRLGRIASPAVRLPLAPADPSPILEALAGLGVRNGQENAMEYPGRPKGSGPHAED